MEKYTIKDIQRAGFNLEPTYCRNCKKDGFFNFGMGCVICENCGLIDDGGQIKKQLREQEIKPHSKESRTNTA